MSLCFSLDLRLGKYVGVPPFRGALVSRVTSGIGPASSVRIPRYYSKNSKIANKLKYAIDEPKKSRWEEELKGDGFPPMGKQKRFSRKEDERVVAFTLDNVSKYIGDEPLFEGVNLRLFKGSKVGILGPNGSGKSTLMKIIAGIDKEFVGNARPASGYKIGYFAQEPELNEEGTVLDNILDGVMDKISILRRFDKLKAHLDEGSGSPKDRLEYERLLKVIEKEKLLDLRRRIEVNMEALNCPPPEKVVRNLSGGERRRVALCRLLTSGNDILLLDEPTNHLDTESIAWLERFLCEYRGTVVVITHDRYFLDNVTNWIVEIDRGSVIKFDGNYSEWLYEKQRRLELEKRREMARARQIKQELEWIRGNRQKNKARMRRFEDLISHEKLREYEPGQILIPPGMRLGKKLIEVSDLKKTFGDRVLFENLSFKIEPGSVVGLIGANGVGKTTLFKVLAGMMECDSGTIEIGQTVSMKYISQERVELKDNETVLDAISEGHDQVQVGDQQIHVRHYMSSFNIKGSLQDRLISDLSGGEKNRVLLAKILKDGCNLLLLDEPSNDLDVDTLRSLEDAICDFSGSALVISHDRWFLDRICTHIIAFEGDSKVVFCNGNYSSYESDKKNRINKNRPYKKIVTI